MVKGKPEMVMFGRLAAGAIAIAVMATAAVPAMAKVTVYDCAFQQSKSRGGGWIPERLVLVEDTAKGEILVNDNVIMYFVKKPIPARKSGETAARSTFSWDVETRVQNQASKMTYTFSYFRNGQPAKMRAQPGGYDNVWSGEGTCKVGTK